MSDTVKKTQKLAIFGQKWRRRAASQAGMVTSRDGFGVRIGADPFGMVGRWSVGAGPADPAGGLLVGAISGSSDR